MTYLLAVSLVSRMGDPYAEFFGANSLTECNKKGQEETERTRTDHGCVGSFVCIENPGKQKI